jgi:glutamate dehydrogenase
MRESNESQRISILDQLEEHNSKEAPKKTASDLWRFMRQFYSSISTEDLGQRTVEELYVSALSFYQFLAKRGQEEVKLRLFNPTIEKDQWQSTHTIIELCVKDMQFVVDSVRMAINKHGLLVHLVVHSGCFYFDRDKKGQLTRVLDRKSSMPEGSNVEAVIYLEVDRIIEPSVFAELQEDILRVLGDVNCSVVDWAPMRDVVVDCLEALAEDPPPFEISEINETKDFLSWLLQDHFTFLGSRDYKFVDTGEDQTLQLIPKSGLGVLKEEAHSQFSKNLAALPPKVREMMLSDQLLLIAKTNTISSVHRSAYTDYIGIKRFDRNGKLIGIQLVIGLYTSSAYNSNPRYIPFLRLKVSKVLKRSKLALNGHDGKALFNILETLPRDDLFQASTDELYELALGILHLQERQRTRLFIRRDSYNRYFSCLVFVPREKFNTDLRRKIQKVLTKGLGALDSTFEVQLPDSMLARIHYIVRIDPKKTLYVDADQLESVLIETAKSWEDNFKSLLIKEQGEALGLSSFERYSTTFGAAYQENYDPTVAISDMKHIERLSEERPVELGFRQITTENAVSFQLKMYRPDTTSPLSDVLPILENMGLRVLGERPSKLTISEGKYIWVNDFQMEHVESDNLTAETIKEDFIEAFIRIWFKKVENDEFNRLILEAGLGWKSSALLRTYARYLKQVGFTFSQEYIADALYHNPIIANALVAFFDLKFNPALPRDEKALLSVRHEIEEELENVTSLDQDRILRRILALMDASLRTNYYTKTVEGRDKHHISIKFDSGKIPEIPLPAPMFEIFVYSPRVEGVHLRGAKVARGGLRWSDRREDFRTEILGLMKAQQVKNSVIVPLGAKGGFVTKMLPMGGDREQVMSEVISCYQTFIKALLEITDNIVEGKTITPDNVVRHDDLDSYLVVAADKGTSTFSDIANQISEDYNFWLGDAFASGGSTGYDHKKMGITARGAWECTKRHFREMRIDTQTTDFTVIGVGDMAGDVFGNGMLASEHIKLVAAFNHMHIFLDPNPNSATSFKERKRLFELPRSTWDDYNRDLISSGGGIYNRSAKSIKLSGEVKKLLDLDVDSIAPNDFLQAILRSSVDLLWSGGIGTFVKASSETDLEAGDKANDFIRVNADELRCKVVVEGGNLGLTQLARIQYAKTGGRINTDFIDNSAGVDCSDHEVNIKILLNSVVAKGNMTEEQRNELLIDMTDEVASLVLKNNYLQTETLSLEEYSSIETVDLFRRYLVYLEKKGKINRALEFLPSEEEIKQRKALGTGFTRPEISVLMAYDKTLLKEKILASKLPEDGYFIGMLQSAFPSQLRERFTKQMQLHTLKREIIATQLSNFVTNMMGINFVTRLHLETGVSTEFIVRAFVTVQAMFAVSETWEKIRALDYTVSTDAQFSMTLQLYFLIRRTTRWILRNHKEGFDIQTVVKSYAKPIAELKENLIAVINPSQKVRFQDLVQEYTDQNVPAETAFDVARCRYLFHSLDIIKAATESNCKVLDLARMYYFLSGKFELNWLRWKMINHNIETQWDELARSALLDDLDMQQRNLSIKLLTWKKSWMDEEGAFKAWHAKHEELYRRWDHFLTDMRASENPGFIMYSVMLSELFDLADA